MIVLKPIPLSRPQRSALPLWAVALTVILASCASAGNGRSDASDGASLAPDWIVGQWSVQGETGSGPSLVIVMDSVVNDTIHGHVLRYMSGNVGRGPRDFLPFTTAATPDGLIPVTVEMADTTSPPIRVVFQRVQDFLVIREFVLGAEDMTARGRRWVARRLE